MERHKDKEKNTNTAKILGAAAVASLVAAVGINTMNRESGPQLPSEGSPYNKYQVKTGDTAYGLLTKAYPDKDWRPLMGIIDSQLDEADRANHELHPGQTLIFDDDAEIGKTVDPTQENTSARSG